MDFVFILIIMVIFSIFILVKPSKEDKEPPVTDDDVLEYPKSIIKEEKPSPCDTCPHNNPEQCSWINGWGCRG